MHNHHHDPFSRRDCLRLGLGGLFAGGLSGALRATAATSGSSAAIKPQAKSCILIWMDGGPSHIETFDPKPTAPIEIRGQFKPIATRLSGVQFSQHLVRLAECTDKFSLVRSICHDQGNHGAGNHYMMTGMPTRIPVGCGAFVSYHPSLGSAAAKEIGAPAGLPPYFSIPIMARSGGPSFLGGQYAPFVVSSNPNAPNFQIRDVAVPKGLLDARFQERKALRQQVDRLQRLADEASADPLHSVDEYYQQGYQLVTSKSAQEAFDIEREPDSMRDRYGRTPFGQRALLSRRLVEAGVPFVTLLTTGWDHHRSIFTEISKRLPEWDHTVATLIADLSERGMLESTLVVVLGEFGGTPQVNSRGGRDHWSNAMSVLFAGGGTPGGQVIGATDAHGFAPVERKLSPENFASTIYTKLGIDPNKIYHTPDGRPMHLVSDPNPIPELMG